MHSIHLYTSSSSHLPNVTAPLAAERAIEITSSLIDLARVENQVPPEQLRPTICFDEWNVWDPIRAEGSQGAEESYTLSDALAVAVWLNVFVPDDIPRGNYQADHLVAALAVLAVHARLDC
jgi:alpha-N-arabinofuranosidase